MQVDYTRSSTVWASDKWKGVFKVRWIFVRDIPNANLRHIRLKYVFASINAWARINENYSAIPKSASQSRTRVTLKSFCQMPVRRCCASSTLTRRGRRSCRTSLSMRFGFISVLNLQAELMCMLIATSHAEGASNPSPSSARRVIALTDAHDHAVDRPRANVAHRHVRTAPICDV